MLPPPDEPNSWIELVSELEIVGSKQGMDAVTRNGAKLAWTLTGWEPSGVGPDAVGLGCECSQLDW